MAAEGLAAHLVAVLGLRLLASVPGAVGRLAAGAGVLATPAAVRRALDLLLGGALLAQATLAPLPPERLPLPRRCGAVGAGTPLPPWLAVVRPDPDPIHCGTRLLVPPYRPNRDEGAAVGFRGVGPAASVLWCPKANPPS